MSAFDTLGLSEPVLQLLQKQSITTPTPIQAQAIPEALSGKDILGCAQTGTGKTLAFGLPLVEKLAQKEIKTALVLAPTRELAEQVFKELRRLLPRQAQSKAVLLIGGEPMPKQLYVLRKPVQLIVGTPGRVNDHLDRGTLKLNDVGYFVLDETDRMLDMGFSIQIDRIVEHLPKQRQTLLLSATLPHNIIRLSKRYLDDPVTISVKPKKEQLPNIKHTVIKLNEKQKLEYLLAELEARHGSVIVFVKTKRGAEKLAYRLQKEKYPAEAIHGDLRQNKRQRLIRHFRAERFRIMVATDVAARGLDIPHIEHVINYDLPQCPEDYIHRIGRTGRAGKSGEAVCFVTSSDERQWYAIDRLMNPDTAKKPPFKKKGGASAKRGYSRSRGGDSRSRSGDFRSRRSDSRSRSDDSRSRSGDFRSRRSDSRSRSDDSRSRSGDFRSRNADSRSRSGDSKPSSDKKRWSFKEKKERQEQGARSESKGNRSFSKVKKPAFSAKKKQPARKFKSGAPRENARGK